MASIPRAASPKRFEALIVHGFTISLDGYGAGPHQSLEAPLGIDAEVLHDS